MPKKEVPKARPPGLAASKPAALLAAHTHALPGSAAPPAGCTLARSRLTRCRPPSPPAQVVFVAAFSGLTVEAFTAAGSPVADRYIADLRAAASLTTGVPEGDGAARMCMHACGVRARCRVSLLRAPPEAC